jgi:hypothetical protein
MKIKNHYILLCVIWVIASISNAVSCVVNFVDGKLAVGFIFLILSVSFSFVSGILLNKAVVVYWHNKEVKWLHEIAEELKEEAIQQIKPFEEFEND